MGNPYPQDLKSVNIKDTDDGLFRGALGVDVLIDGSNHPGEEAVEQGLGQRISRVVGLVGLEGCHHVHFLGRLVKDSPARERGFQHIRTAHETSSCLFED